MAIRELIQGLAHVGIRVHDLDRSTAFYEILGFTRSWGPFGPDRVTAMVHPSGLEINLIVNAAAADDPNVLVDGPQKHAGITHIALKIDDVGRVEAALKHAGIAISGRRGEPATAVFIRDPDRNVIELAAD
jgi:lactoylglutathione lyase